MDKLNITEGEWNSLEDQVYSGTEGMVANCMVRGEPEEENANAKAIVTAVNNTYKAGIDPEAVPDMFDALVDVNNYNEEPCQEHYDIMMESVKSALKKAEL